MAFSEPCCQGFSPVTLVSSIMISSQCVARDLHTIVPWPLERTCWKEFAAQ